MMKRFALIHVWVAALALSAPARADPADDLVVLLGYDQVYSTLVPIMVEQGAAKLHASGLTGGKLDAARATLQTRAQAYRASFRAEVVQSFRKRYTDAELLQLKAFYGSPQGVKVAASQPAIRDDVAAATRNAALVMGAETAQLAGH